MSHHTLESMADVPVNGRGAARVRRGHPWIYRSDVEGEGPSEPGLVRVTSRGKLLGTALWSPASEIRLRMLTTGKQEVTRSLLAERMRRAWQHRERTLPGATAFRWIHGEADELPGLFVDRYEGAISLQTTCGATDRLEPMLTELLDEIMRPDCIVLRNDASTRAREGLTQRVEVLKGQSPVTVTYREGEVALAVDLTSDQKTGGYLDQSSNHVRAAGFARPGARALDCFTYHGGFALQLARAGAQVTAVDQSAQALTRAQQNAERNGLSIEFLEENVFDTLSRMHKRGTRELFDIIVLDPPAFASGRHSLPAAERAYKEINLRAMGLLAPGGILISCSCSGRMRPEAFDEMLAAAAADARRSSLLLERHGAGPDHPVRLGVPETEYLKCRILTVW